MRVIIWRTQHKNMKGIKAIYIILISWTVDCYPLAESVGLSHGSTGPSHHRSQGAVAASAPAVHHASHGAVAQPAAAHHASHGISSGYGYSGGLSSGYDSGYSSGGYEGGHSSGGYGYDEYEKPDPFQFEYGVHDDHYYTDFSEHRSGDEAGNIYGYYEVALPDGRIQYVKYEADGHYGGTVMEVKYTGEARHPESYGGYQDSGYHAEHGAVAKPHVF